MRLEEVEAGPRLAVHRLGLDSNTCAASVGAT